MLSTLIREAANTLRQSVGDAAVNLADTAKNEGQQLAKEMIPVVSGLTQAGLAAVGVYKGKVENEFGELSQAALQQFEEFSEYVDTKIDETGTVTAQALENLAMAVEAGEVIDD